MKIFLLILFGALSGVFGGMGMGGGTTLIPLLTIFLSFNQRISQGYNLISFLIMSIIALIIHSKNKLVCWKIVLPLGICGAICSVGGSLLANNLNGKILKILFGAFLIILAIYQLIVIIKAYKDEKEKQKEKSHSKINNA